jgi:two-component system NarL family response regulator
MIARSAPVTQPATVLNAVSRLPAPQAIRLFIIDPQPLIAAALGYLFAANTAFSVVGTAQLVAAVVLRAASPDVVLLCQEHGSTDLADMVGACSAAVPAAKVCVVACHSHHELGVRVLASGAVGYAVKDANPAELIEAVIGIHNGAKYLDPRIEAGTIGANGAAHRTRTLNPLSVRETEVLKLIAGGYSNREISIALSLSEKTIKNHISHIFAKLHITARTQAVIHAIKTGIA